MEYKVELHKEFAVIYEEAAKHANMPVEDMLQQALMNYICICAEK
jgi:predicted HTH domain antitoxin